MDLEKKALVLEILHLRKHLDEYNENIFLKSIQHKKNECNNLISQSDFFKDKKKSQDVYNQLKIFDSYLMPLAKFNKDLVDCSELCELVNEDDFDTLQEIQHSLVCLKKELEEYFVKLLFNGEYDSLNSIVEINAGAGGQDAQEWVSVLYRMYKQYCAKRGYTTKELDSNPTEGGGYKNVAFLVSGEFVYGYLKAEKGVHRLVRISPFDSSSRRHTSFASVEVVPEILDEMQVDIKVDDIRIDTFRSGGAGGQHVNKTDSAVRITHIPTGIVVACQNERSQIQNKETAFKMLRSKLAEKKERELAEKNKTIKGDLKKIEWGSQIRSYVFAPYTMVKDHRTNFEDSDVERVVNGDIHQFVLDYLKKSQGE